MRAQYAEDQGVTLIELIIVVTLMAVLAGIGLPRMASMFSISTLEAAGVEAMTTIKYAQSRAVASGTVYRVSVDASAETIALAYETIGVSLLGNEAQLDELDVETKTFSAVPHPLKRQEDYVINFLTDPQYRDIVVDSVVWDSGTTLEFSADGIPSAGGTVTLSNGRNQIAITIDAATGRVTMGLV